MDAFANSFDVTDVPEVSSYEDYEHLKAKQRASVLWLLSKAYNNDIPPELRDPFYKDNEEQDRLKPQITQSLANAELYCLALANIYSDPNYHCLNHHGIMQMLMRKGVYMIEPHDGSLTETVLVQTAPLKMSAHMVIIEGIMTLYIKEVLIPEKVAEVVNRFTPLDFPEELPEDPEEAALFWINKCCVKLKQIMQRDLNEDESTRSEPMPTLPMLEDLTDMSDGCCLAALLSFYCPDHLRWQEICLNKDMSMADSIYNLQLVQFFCQEKLPYNICFLSLEDFLYLHETIHPNVLAFIADLLFLFEIRPAKCVRQPYIDYDNDISKSNDNIHNGSSLCYPELPTPAEMKAKSLQHSSWIDETRATQMEQRNGSTPNRPPRRLSANSKSRRKSSLSYGQSDEDEELTRYFSALDIKADVDSSPEILMITERNEHKIGVRTGPKSIASYSNNNRDYKDDHFDHDEHYLSNSQSKNNDNSNNKSHLADYFTQLSNSSPSKKSTPNTTSFAKLNSENSKNISMNSNQEPAINIAYMQKNDKSVNSDRITQKSNSSRSIPHINKSDSVKEILEQNNVSNNDSVERQNSSDNEIASQIYNIRMKLEEKRKKIEFERKSAEEQWKSQRQNIGKEAFLRVVHKTGNEENVSEKSDVNNKRSLNDKHLVNNEKRESISMNDVVQEVDTLKKKWFKDSVSNDDNKLISSNQSSDNLRASIDLMESSITDIDADLERLQEHEQLIQLHSNAITNNLEKTKFYLHSIPDLQNSQQQHPQHPQSQQIQKQPQHQHQQHFPIAEQQSPHPQQFHSLSLHQNMQAIAPPMVSQAMPSTSVLPPHAPLAALPPQQMWNDSQMYAPNETTPPQVGPRRGQWGQPVMPVSSNAGNGINQWKAVPMQPAMPPTMPSTMPPQLDASYTSQGYEPYNLQSHRQTVNMPYSQAFHGMVAPNSYNMGGHYASLNPQQTSFAHQNGPIPPSQYNFQGYSPSQYTNNANVGQNFVQSSHYNPNVNSGMNYNQSVPAMMVNAEQSYHSIPYNTYNNQQLSIAQQDKSQQMRPLVTSTLINSQSANNSTVSITPQSDDYSQQQLSSSPTNKHFIGRTFRVAKPKVLLPEYSAHNSPTRALSENSNDDMNNGKAESSSGSSTTKDISNSGDLNYPNESFFISFEKEGLKSKPGLKPKQVKQKQQMKREQKLANAQNLLTNNNQSNENVSHSDSPYLSQNSPKPSSPSIQNSVSPGVGFIIGSELVNPDPSSETEMAKKKELIMLHSLKRRAEQEAKRAKKEQELAHKRDDDRQRREESEKKREEERIKRHLILEQYRQRKAMEEAEKNGSHISGNSSFHSSKDSSRSNSTLALNRPLRQRVLSGGKPRPKSLHVSASNIQDYSSLDCKPSRIMDDVDASYPNILSSNCVASASRPQSAMSQNSIYSRRLPSPTSHNHSPSHQSALPTAFIMNRHKGPPSDGASDAGSTFSEYTGPKLFVKPSQKSNKVLILNAINVVLAGVVNNDIKKKVIEEINGCDSKHYLILFRNAGLQFRAIYSYNPDREEVLKLHGTGPKTIFNEMIDRFYKYNSGSKSFIEIQTKHMSVTIDAFTIQNNIWVGKKILPKKDYL